jgi:GT2 family glycosyltransferase
MRDAQPAVAVVIVNWNGRHHLEHCLPALAAQTYSRHEVVVVDNHSSDDSVAWLAVHWPAVRVLALDENAGFARGNNAGIAATNGPWVALLNNDTRPESGWLAALVEAAEAQGDDLAAVASRMVFDDDPGRINSAGIAVDPTGIAWDWLGGAPFAAGDAPAEVFGASAGACLYRRAALADVAESGPDGTSTVFDPAFFMYLEDVDLAWRLRLRRWRSIYAPDAVVRHVGSASAGEGSAFKNRLLARNKVWTLIRNYPAGPGLRWLPLIILYDLASAPYRLLAQGQSAALIGRLDALRSLRHALASRRQIQARRTADWAELRAVLSPFEPPWAVLRRYRHLAVRRATDPAPTAATPQEPVSKPPVLR